MRLRGVDTGHAHEHPAISFGFGLALSEETRPPPAPTIDMMTAGPCLWVASSRSGPCECAARLGGAVLGGVRAWPGGERYEQVWALVALVT
jgi:hypothetical protein